ncbi:MAG: hypothetical protein WA624_08155, partial [Methylocella sp.]
MLRRDPDRYLPIYKEAHDTALAISAADRSDQRAQLAKLCEQYPFYADFDLVGTRDHVLYADGLSMNSYDEVERHFRDIIRFQALQIALQLAPPHDRKEPIGMVVAKLPAWSVTGCVTGLIAGAVLLKVKLEPNPKAFWLGVPPNWIAT